MSSALKSKAFMEYTTAVQEDVVRMLKAGVRYSVRTDVQSSNEYDTQYLVVLNPQDAADQKAVAGADMVGFGKFWHKEYAETFAEAMNDQIGGQL